jgi:hypothetical protein
MSRIFRGDFWAILGRIIRRFRNKKDCEWYAHSSLV